MKYTCVLLAVRDPPPAGCFMILNASPRSSSDLLLTYDNVAAASHKEERGSEGCASEAMVGRQGRGMQERRERSKGSEPPGASLRSPSFRFHLSRPLLASLLACSDASGVTGAVTVGSLVARTS